MSGHSKWATIKRQKGVNDAARGKLFSKLSKAISLAAKSGPDPESNARLRVVVEQARNFNMPKDNIERAILKGSRSDVQLEEVTYEGFGPGGIGVIVEAATDNRNRTGSEIKNIFDKAGGSLGGPGSVSFNFSPRGIIVVQKGENSEEEILNLIDVGVEDVEESPEGLEVYVAPSEVGVTKDKIEKLGYKILSIDLVRKPKSYLFLEGKDDVKRAIGLLEGLEELDDVQKVYTNLDIEAGAQPVH